MQQKIAQEYAEAFSQCDIILTPTSPSTAFRMGERTDDPLKMYAADICAVTVNIAGLPAILCSLCNGIQWAACRDADDRSQILRTDVV